MPCGRRRRRVMFSLLGMTPKLEPLRDDLRDESGGAWRSTSRDSTMLARQRT